ncbi:MAG: aconitase X swivel domain-containing protein [Acidimicrobiia bacterium]
MFDADVLVPGEAAGSVFLLDEPLSFWGGLNPETGNIIDKRHPQLGQNVSGNILAMAYSRGSSSSTGTLAEAIRLGTAPAAIIMSEPDMIVTLGAMVAHELYGTNCPVIVVGPDVFAHLRNGVEIEILDEGAHVRITGVHRPGSDSPESS